MVRECSDSGCVNGSHSDSEMNRSFTSVCSAPDFTSKFLFI